MSELLEAAKKALPGASWETISTQVSAQLYGRWAGMCPTSDGLVAVWFDDGYERLGDAETAAAWLQADVTARRDALNAALGEGSKDAEIGRLQAELAAAQERVKVVELRSAATPVDVALCDEMDLLISEYSDLMATNPECIMALVEHCREGLEIAKKNFNACARLEAENRDLQAELAALREAVLGLPEYLHGPARLVPGRSYHGTDYPRCPAVYGRQCECGMDAANAAIAAARKLAEGK